jgi:fermentation-respiration switch protein FrsA (DUF1100 family)
MEAPSCPTGLSDPPRSVAASRSRPPRPLGSPHGRLRHRTLRRGATLLESPPTTFREVIRGVTPWYMRPCLHIEVSDALESEDSRRAVALVIAPLLLVVGDQDRVTPPAMATRVLRAASSSSKELRIVPGAAHGNLVWFPAYWDAIDAFSRRVIPARH